MRTAGRSLPDATISAISDRPSLRSRLRRSRRASWFGARRRRSVPPQKGDAYARYTAHSCFFVLFFFVSILTRGSSLHALGTRISAAEDCVPAICATHRRRCGLPFQKRQPGPLSFFGSGFGALFLGAIKTKRSLFSAAEPVYIEAALECRTCCLLRPSWGPAGSSSGGPQRTLRAVPTSPAL